MAGQSAGGMAALPPAEAEALARRAAGAQGVDWPAPPEGARGVGGFAADVTPHSGRERVVWATLPGQTGVLGVFAEERLVGRGGRDLGEVVAVQVADLPELPHLALLVDDSHEQLLGAFGRTRLRRIYVWDGRGLREVFRGALLQEQLHHARWERSTAPQLWRLQRQEGEVAIRDGILTHRVREAHLEAAGRADEPVPPRDAFRLLSVRDLLRRYRWNPRLRRFEPLTRSAEPVGL